MNPETCQSCYFYKPRDVDLDTGELSWAGFCWESGAPVKCADMTECETGKVLFDN